MKSQQQQSQEAIGDPGDDSIVEIKISKSAVQRWCSKCIGEFITKHIHACVTRKWKLVYCVTFGLNLLTTAIGDGDVEERLY